MKSEAGPNGAKGGRGYGKVKYEGRNQLAHRLIFKLMSHDPGDLVLDHLCRQRDCVNPRHLEPTTIRVNTLRGAAVLFKIQERYSKRTLPPEDENGGYDGCSDAEDV